MKTIKQILNTTGYSLPTNWGSLNFADKIHIGRQLKQLGNRKDFKL